LFIRIPTVLDIPTLYRLAHRSNSLRVSILFDKSNAQTLAWVGDFLVANDQVGVFVSTWGWADDALFWNDADDAIEIVLGVNQMRNLALGAAQVFMDRWNAVDVSEGTSVGGRIRNKYRATNIAVTVIDSSSF
jgi:hypothetical protein